MSKNSSTRVNKAAWTLVEGIKDAAAANITTAARTGEVSIKPADLPKLLAIVAASIEEGYHKGSKVFGRVVDDVVSQAEMPPLQPPAKKKSAG